MSHGIAPLRLTVRLGDGREIEFLQLERQPNKELKVQKMYKSSTKNFQPGLKPNNEQKADEMHVSSAIAKPNVARFSIVVNLL